MGDAKIVSLDVLAYKANFGITAFLGLLALPFVYHAHALKKFRASVIKPMKHWWLSTTWLWIYACLALSVTYFVIFISLMNSTNFVYGSFSFLPILWLFLVAGTLILFSSISSYYLPLWLAGSVTLTMPFFLTLWAVQNQAGNIFWANLLLDYMLTPGFSVSHEVNWISVINSILLWIGALSLAMVFLKVEKFTWITSIFLIVSTFGFSFGLLGLSQPAQIARDSKDSICLGTSPEICIWPEIDSVFPEQRNLISTMVNKMKDLQFKEFRAVSVSTAVAKKDSLILPDQYTQDKTPLAKTIATSVIKIECPLAVDPSGRIVTSMQAQIALAILLGADPVLVAPGVQIETAPTPTSPGTSKTLGGMDSLRYFGLENATKVQNLFNRWSQQETGACR